jgi:hypothetical protein
MHSWGVPVRTSAFRAGLWTAHGARHPFVPTPLAPITRHTYFWHNNHLIARDGYYDIHPALDMSRCCGQTVGFIKFSHIC